jgi:PIN domain nuclease of toxin-antitoxin system
VSLLLDTHTVLWWLAGDPLAPEAAERIADPRRLVVLSAASVWEIAIKSAAGKLRADDDLIGHLEASGFEPLPISWHHAERAGSLPPHHRDPFDRMLIAQAQIEGLTIVSRDRAFAAYDVAVLTC